MAIETAVGSFTVPSGSTSNITVSLSGFNGATPDVVLFWGFDNLAFARGPTMSWGWAISSTNRAASGRVTRDDGNSTIRVSQDGSDSHCFIGVSAGGSVESTLDFVSKSADQFTVVPDDDFESESTIGYLALGGSDLSVAGGTQAVTANSGGGTNSVTGLTFQPTALMTHGPILSGGGDSSSDAFTVGITDGTTEYVIATGGHETSPSDNDSMMRTDRVFQSFNPSTDAVDYRALSFNSFNADGFTLNVDASTTGDWSYGWLALDAPNVAVVTQALQTSTGQFSNTNLSFTPASLITFGVPELTSSSSSLQAHVNQVLGAVDSGGDEGSTAAVDQNGVSTTNTAVRTSTTHLISGYQDPTEADHGSLVEVQHVSMNSDGFTWDQTDADAVASLMGVLALGGEAGGGASSLPILTPPAIGA